MDLNCYLYENNQGRSVLNPCNLVLERDIGPVPLSRVIQPPTRIKHEQDEWLKTADVEPPISTLEVQFLKSQLGEVPEVLPWKIGRGLFSPNPANMFVKLENIIGQPFFAGPSGTTADVIQLANLFDGYQYLTPAWYGLVAACIVWLTGARHHSTDEIMMAAYANGVRYDMEGTPDDMLKTVLQRMYAPIRR